MQILKCQILKEQATKSFTNHKQRLKILNATIDHVFCHEVEASRKTKHNTTWLVLKINNKYI